MAQMTDIMVDLETTGTNPQYAGIIQLGAVKFNHETQEVGDIFDRCPNLLPNRFKYDDTMEFWQKYLPVYNSLMARSEHAEDVFRDFTKWVNQDRPSDGYRFWAKPITFDWTFLQSHYDQLGLPMPFHYRQARDLNTYMAAAKNRGAAHVDMTWCENEHKGSIHNAVSDCLLQLRMLFAASTGVFHEVLPN